MYAQPFTYTYIHTQRNERDSTYINIRVDKNESADQCQRHQNIYCLPNSPHSLSFFFSVSGTRKENFWSLNQMVETQEKWFSLICYASKQNSLILSLVLFYICFSGGCYCCQLCTSCL